MKHKWHHGIEKSTCILCSLTLFNRTARKAPGHCPGPDAESVMICLSLVDRETKPKIVRAWTPEQRYEAMNWAARVHLEASDNKIRVPKMPAFLIRKCAKCGCTDDHTCEGGCFWITANLCSACEGLPSPIF